MSPHAESHATPTPSDWIVRFAHLVPPGGTVLDLAAGAGRHARFFAGRGHPVVALDRTIDRLSDLAGGPGIEIVEADLEDGAPWPLGGRAFDCVVVVNYLYRPLLPILVERVAPGGVLLYRTFAAGNEAHGRPRNPNFLLEAGELLQAVAGRLTVVAYEHGLVERPGPAVVQRICARRDAAPAALLAG